MAGGRPSKLTPELQAELCGLLQEGKPIQPSCQKVGITDQVYRLWRSKARQGDERYQEFFAAVTRARAEGELALWDTAKAGDEQGSSNGSARCAQWLLERTFGERYAQRLNVKLEEGLESLLEVVDGVCAAKDCGCHEAILTALAARRDGGGEIAGEESGEARVH